MTQPNPLADEIFQQITCNNAWHGPACPDCDSTATPDYETGFEAGCAFAMITMRERAEKKAELLALFDEAVNRPCTVR